MGGDEEMGGCDQTTLQASSRGIGRGRTHAVDATTSLQIFRKFIVRRSDGTLDASQIHSIECYETWLHSRQRKVSSEPEKKFQRCLSSHLTAVDGLSPFTEEEEKAILAVLRRRSIWPCFAHCKTRFGHAGFRALGYHEKRAQDANAAAAQPAPKKIRTTATYSLTPQLFTTNSGTAMAETSLVDDTFDLEDVFRDFSNNDELSGLGEPPSDLNIAHSFFSTSLRLISRLSSSIASDLVKYGQSLFRTFLLVTGYFRPFSDVDLQRLFDEFVKKYPKDIVVIIDTMASSFANRFVVQNEISRTILGPLTVREGGFARSLICEEDGQRIAGILYDTMKGRGRHEAEICMRLLCLDNTKVFFDLAFYMDAETSLVVMHGRPRLGSLLLE